MSAEREPGLAVALRYDAPDAPRVVAKGRGEVGAAIIAAAREHGIPLQSDPALAEALSQVELEAHIPEALYRAVAVVIGYVLRNPGPRPVSPRRGPPPDSPAGRGAR
jgi:flagellar biosynthesis protein